MRKWIMTLFLLGLFLVSPTQALAATLSLVPSSGTANRGCNFAVNIDLNATGTQTDGTDAILKYDPTRLTANTIVSGTIYPDYPGNNIDSAAGRITVSGLASVQEAFSGSGTLATINFTVPANAPTGSTAVTFDFDPNDKSKTTDSNVVERGTIADVLNSVVNGNYTIGTGTCGQQTLTTTPGVGGGLPKGAPIATPGGQPATTTLPPAGSEPLTYTLAIIGSILTILGILGLALL